jgi:hypothetical protein
MNSKKALLSVLALFWLGTAYSQEAVVRLRCEGESDGANVYINGHLKGQCPADIGLPEGNIRLQVVKNLDKGRYRTFEKEFFVSSGSVKKFEVTLGEIQFTEEGRRLETARIEAARIAAQKEAERLAAEREAARIQAVRDAPRIAAEKEAARIRAEKEAVAQREAERRAKRSATTAYMDVLSSKELGNKDFTIGFQVFLTIVSPLSLPAMSLSDISHGKEVFTMNDPAAFGNPDSMMAKATQLQVERQKVIAHYEVVQR